MNIAMRHWLIMFVFNFKVDPKKIMWLQPTSFCMNKLNMLVENVWYFHNITLYHFNLPVLNMLVEKCVIFPHNINLYHLNLLNMLVENVTEMHCDLDGVALYKYLFMYVCMYVCIRYWINWLLFYQWYIIYSFCYIFFIVCKTKETSINFHLAFDKAGVSQPGPGGKGAL